MQYMQPAQQMLNMLNILYLLEVLKLLVMQEAQMKRDTLIMLELLFDQKALKEQEVH